MQNLRPGCLALLVVASCRSAATEPVADASTVPDVVDASVAPVATMTAPVMASGAYDAARIPAGNNGWLCWQARCNRRCVGMPGAALPDGTHSEPVCQRVKVAWCMTHELDQKPTWSCYPSALACEANQREHLARANEGRYYSHVSPCTAVP